eukprot:s4516_g6.t1
MELVPGRELLGQHLQFLSNLVSTRLQNFGKHGLAQPLLLFAQCSLEDGEGNQIAHLRSSGRIASATGHWTCDDNTSPIVTDCQRLSPIVKDCHRLSKIVTDCQRLSPIVTCHRNSGAIENASPTSCKLLGGLHQERWTFLVCGLGRDSFVMFPGYWTLTCSARLLDCGTQGPEIVVLFVAFGLNAWLTLSLLQNDQVAILTDCLKVFDTEGNGKISKQMLRHSALCASTF